MNVKVSSFNVSRSRIAAAPMSATFLIKTYGVRLLLGLLLAALSSSVSYSQAGGDQSLDPGVQQLPQLDEYGTGVISDTVVHARPSRPVPFTDNLPNRLPGDATIDGSQAPLPVQGPNLHDDFDNNTPTAWWIYTGQTAAQVTSTINNDHARIIDLAVDSATPTFTVTYVQNAGSYAKAWWWYYGQTVAQVSAELSANNARLISVKAYDAGGGQIRYAVVMISNTGSDAKAWWWYVGKSVSSLSSLLTTNHARLIAVDPYVPASSNLYTAIMVDNTGANATGWWWYIDATPNTLANNVSQNNARIYYMTNNGNGTLNAIMESCSGGCSEWWYYYGLNASQILNYAGQNGARLVNLSRSAGCGGACFSGAMINNSNAVTTRVGNLIRKGGISGTEGLYLKKVAGSTLAALEDGAVFEPASTIKAVANLYATYQVQQNAVSLTTPITHYTNGAGSCPNPPVVSGTETLGLALREMMFHSDNTRTREVTDRFTDSAINSYAQAKGLTHTSINHYIGCGGPTPDTLTLDDAGKLYEGVANQTLLNARSRGIFYSNMAGRAQFESEGYDWTGLWTTDIPNIINQVAPVGYTAAQKTAYYNAMNLAYKAGNYVLCTNNNCTNVVEDISIAGWFQLPVCSGTSTTYSEYVFGVFFSNEPNTGWFNGKVTQADTNFNGSKSELLREQIQAGMASCLNKSLNVLTWGPADLVWAKVSVGNISGTKTVTLTNKQAVGAASLAISVFGDFSQTNNCGTSLAAGSSCTISVKFIPTTVGERTGAVIITDNASGQPETVQLTGTGQ